MSAKSIRSSSSIAVGYVSVASPASQLLLMEFLSPGEEGSRRTIADLSLDQIPVLNPPDLTGEGCGLLPGDIFVARGTGKVLSRLVTELDGYWSHSGIYVGDGQVVHAYTTGVAQNSLKWLADQYSEGIGFIRLRQLLPQRLAAAEWARSMVEEETDYSGVDLGQAYAILRRGLTARRAAPASAPTADPDPKIDPDTQAQVRAEIDEALARSSSDEAIYSATCSGFVYDAFTKGAGVDLAIQPARGIEIRNGLLCPIDQVEASSGGPDLIRQETFTRFEPLSSLVAEAVAGCLAVVLFDEEVEIREGVTPADLWCSPDVESRWFLTPAHQIRALDRLQLYFETAAEGGGLPG